MLLGTLEPAAQAAGKTAWALPVPYAWYPWLYTLKIVADACGRSPWSGPAIASFPCG